MPLLDLIGWAVGAMLVVALVALVVLLVVIPFLYSLLKD